MKYMKTMMAAFALASVSAMAQIPGVWPPGVPIPYPYNLPKDPRSNLVWENAATGEHLIWVMQNGQPTGEVIHLPRTSPDWRIVGVADMISDGNADLVWENIRSGEHLIWLFKDGHPTTKLDLPTMPLNWHLAACGHFEGYRLDSQGNPVYAVDLVWENTSTGERVIWLMDHGVPTVAVKLPTVPPNWHIVMAFDYLREQQSNLMFQDTQDGGRLVIWEMAGATPVSSTDLGQYGDIQIAGTADFYGDGQSDWIYEEPDGQSFIDARITERGPSGLNYLSLPTVPQGWHIVNH